MASRGSWRSSPLPGNWGSIRRAVLQRDPMCRYGLLPDEPGEDGDCGNPSEECDHIGEPDDHRMAALRGLCHDCHLARTKKQTSAAVSAGMKRWHGRKLRPQEKHPGYL
jgi:5-methylcytosine-specific restriction enzyme A